MDERDSKILTLYREGKKMKEIAAAVGMASNSIVYVLRRLGVERPSKPQKRWRGRPDESEKIRSLWKEGLCVSQIAERVGGSEQAIGKVLDDAKLRSSKHPRTRWDQGAPGGPGRSGFAGAMARKT